MISHVGRNKESAQNGVDVSLKTYLVTVAWLL